MAYLDYALIEKSTLGDIGDAIREKTGGIKLLDPANFVSEISKIPSEADKVPLQDKVITSNGEYAADEGYYGLGAITVNVESSNSSGGGDSIINRTIAEYENDNIKKIGNYAFYKCGDLSSVNCPSVSELGTYAFGYCSSLKDVNLPNVENLNSYSFYNCTSLSDLYLPRLNKTAYCSFYNSSLASISLPSCTYISDSAFSGCSNLSNVDIPNATSINGYAFNYCSKIEELNFPLVTSLYGYYLFANMTGLQKLYLPSLKNISNVNYMMYQSTNVTDIDFSGVETISNSSRLFDGLLYNISLPNLKSITNSHSLFYDVRPTYFRRIDFGHVATLPTNGTSSKHFLYCSLMGCGALIFRVESVLNIGSNEMEYIKSRNNYDQLFIYVPKSVLNEYKNQYTDYSDLFRAIEDYPYICAVDWKKEYSPIINYGGSNTIGASSGRMLLEHGRDFVKEVEPYVSKTKVTGGYAYYFVGWSDDFEISDTKNLLTEFMTTEDTCIYPVYGRKIPVRIYNGDTIIETIEDVEICRIDIWYTYVNENGGTTGTSATTLIPGRVAPPETHDEVPGYDFLGWTSKSSSNEVTQDEDGNVLIYDNYNSYGYFGPLYGQNVTLHYTSDVYDDGFVEDQIDQRCLNRAAWSGIGLTIQPKFIVSENNFIRQGYKFVGWALSSDRSKVYNPGDTFNPGVLNEYELQEYTLVAVWEEYTV